MEKRKQGRPKVDTHITDGQFNNRRQELNYKYMFEGTGVLIDAADEIPERTILYEIDDTNLRFKACKNTVHETDHALITWISCTDHVFDHTLFT